MDSKWKWPALKIARWGLQHGQFFDLYDVAYRLGIPPHEAGKVMSYLRSLRHVEKEAETCQGDLHVLAGHQGVSPPPRGNRRFMAAFS